MEEQNLNNIVAAPSSPKGNLLKMIIVNVLISAIVSLVVSFAVVGLLGNRVSILEAQMEKQMKTYKVK